MASSNIVVGRSRECELILDDATVSSHHARLSWEGGRILVEDLGSANGTFLRGKRVDRVHVKPGDDLRIGQTSLPWSHKSLREFLRAGAGTTMVAQPIKGRRYRCGGCGGQGVFPVGAKEFKCVSCGVALQMGKRRSGGGVLRALVLLLALGAIAGAGYALLRKGAVTKATPRNVAEKVTRQIEQALPVTVGSKEEASIRVHVLEKVTAAIEPNTELTRNTAVKAASSVGGPFSVQQVAQIWSEVRRDWKYVNDPRGSEYFARASESITNDYAGDCDDFAIVLVSMIEAIGGEARIVMMNGPQGGHAYAEAKVVGSLKEIRTKLDVFYRRHKDRKMRKRVRTLNARPATPPEEGDAEEAFWVNLDWSAGVPGGPYEAETWAVAVYPDARTETLSPSEGPKKK